MADTIVTFQSQLSGVMETVFKAAMYEITRLVEESFLVEMARCREQVDTMKRRLKWTEGRRKERPDLRCADCGRVGLSNEERSRTAEKNPKQEHTHTQEGISSSLGTDVYTAVTDVGEEKPEAQNTTGSTGSPGGEGKNLDRLPKEEALHEAPEANESQQRWGVRADETGALGRPGPSKCFGDQKIPKSHTTWEDGSEQRGQSGQLEHPGDLSETLFHNRYGLEDLSGFDKSGYDDTSMIEMGSLDGLRGSPSQLGEEMNYMDHYEGNVEAPEGIEHQQYQTAAPKNRRATVGSHLGSPSKRNVDLGGEFCGLLINEEGYIQDPNMLYSEQISDESGGRFRGKGIQTELPLDITEGIFGPPDANNGTVKLGERVQPAAGGRAARRHFCHQCAMSFPDSASLKAHKQTHKVFPCAQCGKTFTHAANLKVHQRIHSGHRLHFCSHCGKSFPYFSDLKRHNCAQASDKPYCCAVCGNKFSRLWNLKLHQRIHTQEKPHQCSMCDKSFTRADILKVHQRTHTGERPYCCTVCGLSFKRLDHLKSHQRKHI